jgi:hypothetical protein
MSYMWSSMLSAQYESSGQDCATNFFNKTTSELLSFEQGGSEMMKKMCMLWSWHGIIFQFLLVLKLITLAL